jgi:ABC-2 type transport system ATP-binding protein
MAEAEELCQRIAIINKGRIVALDSPDALKRRISGDSVIEATVQAVHAQVLLDHLRVLDTRTVVDLKNSIDPEKICIRTPEPSRVLELLSPYLKPEYILGLEVRNQTLEDVYVTIIKGDEQ